ncbi:MAG TPA: hypothetical protein VJ952_05005 [Opitutales bacterium]|nr:hypothetical protein [Opitutales bacterium]
MLSSLRIAIFKCLLLAAVVPLNGEVPEDGLADGLALVTTAKGGVIFRSPDGTEREAELHAVETLSGMEVGSGEDEQLFLALSNGSAIGIHENSQLRFVSYRQRPFPPEKESLDYEPSLSTLVIRLSTGSLSFSADQISPLSRVLIQLPGLGRIRIHEASGRVSFDERGAEIAITSGIVGYTGPGMDEEEFINSPHAVRISRSATEPGRISMVNLNGRYPSKELTELLVEATHRAKNRVVFKVPVGDEASIPRPVLVARPEALLKPTPRPYTYRD